MLKKGTKEYRDHIVKLAAVSAMMLDDPRFDPRDMDDDEWHNTRNCLSILAEGFTILASESADKPRFRAKANTAEAA